MHPILYIQSAASGILMVNGVFCGPLEGDGRSFPAGKDAEIYIQFFPFRLGAALVTAAMRLSGGKIVRLEPQESVYALLWPDGIIQLELRADSTDERTQGEGQPAAANTLLRYLTMRLLGEAQAELLLMRPQDAPNLAGYEAALPLRFAPLHVSERFDERAGLLRRLSGNVAAVDAVLAATVPVGQGMKRIERIEVVRT